MSKFFNLNFELTHLNISRQLDFFTNKTEHFSRSERIILSRAFKRTAVFANA